MQYNCINGFDYLYFMPLIPLGELDSTNLIADPLLDFQEGLPHLSADSPCIDAGDPDSPHDPDGTRSDIGARYFHHEATVPRDPPSASDFQLSAFPNPFNSSTKITFGLDPSADGRLDVYDLSGRLVAELLNRRGVLQYAPTATTNKVVWNASAVPAGVYLVRLETGEEVAMRKIVLMR